jgi:phosphoribosylanthranilate isomerase
MQKPKCRTRVKMCGMTCANDIAHAITLGVDAIGLIFYEKSARHVTIEQAKLILKDIPAFVDVVAVFVNPTESLVAEVITELPIQLLQFHGDELPEFCTQFGRSYIKATPAVSSQAIIKATEQHQQAAAILLDTPSANRGGTGKVFDWKVIPSQLTKPVILAGGIDLSNVASAISAISPYAVDVCSGVEKSPGIKDYDKMNKFVHELWRE